MKLWNIAFCLTLIFWPLSFYLNYAELSGPKLITIDYQSRQEVVRNANLYPNIPLARMFQNKANVVTNKFYSNFFALIDLNNYFFGFAPRQIVDNQNLIKFPFLAIIPFLIAIFNLKRKNNDYFLIFIISTLIVLLSLLSNFDKYDFVLWIPISLIIYKGILRLNTYKHSGTFFVVYSIFALIELMRIIATN